MNTTVLALQEEQVLVAVGKSGAQPSVQALYSAPAHGGGMENWEKAIGALWQQHRLPSHRRTINNKNRNGCRIFCGTHFFISNPTDISLNLHDSCFLILLLPASEEIPVLPIQVPAVRRD